MGVAEDARSVRAALEQHGQLLHDLDTSITQSSEEVKRHNDEQILSDQRLKSTVHDVHNALKAQEAHTRGRQQRK